PVVDRATPTVILTQRTADLPSHAGQIAFPGGKIDPPDETPVEAALREAEEEVGLAPALVEPLGYLDLYLTFSRFRILPTVARIAPDFALELNRSEVAEVFEVPLDFLMTPGNYRRKSRDWNGIIRHYYEIPYLNRYIWGVTAGILRNLYERIYTRVGTEQTFPPPACDEGLGTSTQRSAIEAPVRTSPVVGQR